jgi:isopropylmalate/homocitrate/citramalate synthase
MDSQYLKQHINDALSEALSSMAVALPEDSVEYVGNFLIEYCERRKRKAAVRIYRLDTNEAHTHTYIYLSLLVPCRLTTR